MAHANVSNGILTIIASFSNGLDVLKKLRQSKKTPKQRSEATNMLCSCRVAFAMGPKRSDASTRPAACVATARDMQWEMVGLVNIRKFNS
jgi:hypothetical protein